MEKESTKVTYLYTSRVQHNISLYSCGLLWVQPLVGRWTILHVLTIDLSFSQSSSWAFLTSDFFWIIFFFHFFFFTEPLLFLILARTSSRSAEKKICFHCISECQPRFVKGFGRDLQTFERNCAEIQASPPPSLQNQVLLDRNRAKIYHFSWGFVWDFGLELKAKFRESNLVLAKSRFTLSNVLQY